MWPFRRKKKAVNLTVKRFEILSLGKKSIVLRCPKRLRRGDLVAFTLSLPIATLANLPFKLHVAGIVAAASFFSRRYNIENLAITSEFVGINARMLYDKVVDWIVQQDQIGQLHDTIKKRMGKNPPVEELAEMRDGLVSNIKQLNFMAEDFYRHLRIELLKHPETLEKAKPINDLPA